MAQAAVQRLEPAIDLPFGAPDEAERSLPVAGFKGTSEEIERQWYEQVYRGHGDSMAQLTRRAVLIYETPYLSHSPCGVHLQQDRLDVWVGTQDAEDALHAAARFSGLKPEQVYIHNAFLGGGFGRRSVRRHA
jgi:CO/xanthine dehydrogenase Mo-binding subunit